MPLMSKATVKVTMRLSEKHSCGDYSGKFAARVGEVLVMQQKIHICRDEWVMQQNIHICRDEWKHEHELPTYKVVVPYGSVLSIEVDWQIIKSSERVKHLQVLKFDIGTLSGNTKIDGHEIEVDIIWGSMKEINEGTEQEFIIYDPPQPQSSRPAVEAKMMSGNDIAIVYTIGDEVSFSEFITALRCILADHSNREDIFDGHDMLNLSSTREHPVLAKQLNAEQPRRWVHVKLQVMEEEEITSWTTLLMRDDNLYVHGFVDQDGGVYGLVDNKSSAMMLPDGYKARAQRREWSAKYRTILGTNISNGVAAHKLAGAHLGRGFAMEAIRVLSRGPEEYVQDGMNPRMALAGLILIVCESARMNPIHDAIAGGWSNGTGFTEQLMRDFVWAYGNKSQVLLTWKRHRYNIPVSLPQHPIKELQDIFLVLNTTVTAGPQQQGENNHQRNKAVDKHTHEGSENSNNNNNSGHQQENQHNNGSGDVQPNQHSHSSNGSQQNQPNRTHNDGSSGDNSEDPSQLRKIDDDSHKGYGKSHGRPRVELFAIRANLGVVGTTIIVFDGKRGQIIYRHEEQQEQEGMVDLVLTGPYTGISAYGCFAIKIEIPHAAPIKWEWDCYDPNYAAEIDRLPVIHRKIDNIAEVTYAVMSDALEATVEVMLHLKDGDFPSDNNGKITALIDGFEVRSDLFSRMQGTDQCFSCATDDLWYLLQLDRNVVVVPCGRLLHIEVDLPIKTSKGLNRLKADLKFENGLPHQSYQDDNGNKVQVNINWYPEIALPKQNFEEIGMPEFITTPEPSRSAEVNIIEEVKIMPRHLHEIVYVIGDELSFISFMMDLHRILADHPDHEDVLDCHRDLNISSTREHPFLAKQHAEQPMRWLHVKLQVVEGDETSSTTLLIRDDNMYVCGFMNEEGVWYGLLDNEDSVNMLPNEYNPKCLHWGVKYKTILHAIDNGEVTDILDYTRLGKDFMVNATGVLSRYPEYVPDDMNPRLALAGLIFMICECARMNPLHDSLVDDWTNGMKYKIRRNMLLEKYVLEYVNMSHELRKWKSRNYTELHRFSLKAIHLVLNTRKPVEAGNTNSGRESKGDGQPRVELLAMRGDLGVVGTKIIVFDGKQGQIIYMKREQGGKGMVDLVLSGPSIGISASGCFAIKIDIPAGPSTGSSSGADGPIKWEWDCYEPKFAAEVDKSLPVTRTISSSSGPGRSIEVTYAVMSNALEARVQVKLRLKDSHIIARVHGKITAHIGDFQVRSILFSRAQGVGQNFSPTNSRYLQLSRSVIAVPYGWELHIEVDLQIETSNNKGIKNLKGDLSFTHENASRSFHVDDDEVEVNITWPEPTASWRASSFEADMIRQPRRPDISYTVGDGGEEGFTKFITGLRCLLADQPRHKDILDDHPDPASASSGNHPVLGREHLGKDAWLHIKLQVADEYTWTTLLVRCEDACVVGFRNQNGDCFMLDDEDPNDKTNFLTPLQDHRSPWYHYRYPYRYRYRKRKHYKRILGSELLVETFAADAVRTLSRYNHQYYADVVDERMKKSIRMALAGLSIIVCESARLTLVHNTIAAAWNAKAKFTHQLMGYIQNWERISSALLLWKDHSYHGWVKDEELEAIGIESPKDALDIIHLVRDVPVNIWGDRARV